MALNKKLLGFIAGMLIEYKKIPSSKHSIHKTDYTP